MPTHRQRRLGPVPAARREHGAVAERRVDEHAGRPVEVLVVQADGHLRRHDVRSPELSGDLGAVVEEVGTDEGDEGPVDVRHVGRQIVPIEVVMLADASTLAAAGAHWIFRVILAGSAGARQSARRT